MECILFIPLLLKMGMGTWDTGDAVGWNRAAYFLLSAQMAAEQLLVGMLLPTCRISHNQSNRLSRLSRVFLPFAQLILILFLMDFTARLYHLCSLTRTLNSLVKCCTILFFSFFCTAGLEKLLCLSMHCTVPHKACWHWIVPHLIYVQTYQQPSLISVSHGRDMVVFTSVMCSSWQFRVANCHPEFP